MARIPSRRPPQQPPVQPSPKPSEDTAQKARTQFFFQRASYPLRDAAPLSLECYWNNQQTYAQAVNIFWEELGPTNFSGRMTCLAVAPDDPKRLYAGSAAGGLWTSDNEGLHWTSIWPRSLNQNIGAIAIDPRNPDQIICATGEANLSSDTYPGSGIFLSYDRGFTWLPYITAPGGRALDQTRKETFPRRVGALAFGRRRPNRPDLMEPAIAIGSVSNDVSLPALLMISDGSGAINSCDIFQGASYNCHSVFFHSDPKHTGWVYAALEPGGTGNGIWLSQDFGAPDSWMRLGRGLPPGEECGRISLAQSPSNPKIIWALIANRRSQVHGVYRSADSGASWEERSEGYFKIERQLRYNNAIAVHPTKPDIVVVGATDLHRTEDGRHWTRISTGARGTFPAEAFPENFVHHDHHAIVMVGRDRIYSAHDGGVSVSTNKGKTWEERSNGLVTTMFYDIDVAASDSRIFGGGCQDAGSLMAGVPQPSPDPMKAKEFVRVLPGDGGWLGIDPADPERVFGSTSDLNLYRHQRGEPWSQGNQLANWPKLNDLEKISEGERKQRPYAPILIESHPRQNGLRKIWIGTHRLWSSEDNGETWNPTAVFDDTAVSALDISSFDSNVMFVGTTKGGVFRSLDGGVTWSTNLAGPHIPKRVITQIATHPADPLHVVLTLSRVGDRTVGLDGQPRPFQTIFESKDLGLTWVPDTPHIPEVVYNALAIESRPPFRVFIAGDAGVWARDPVHGWFSITGNLPNVVVSDLIYHDKDHTLTAATFGRGIWRIKPPDKVEIRPEEKPLDESLLPGQAGFTVDIAAEGPRSLRVEDRKPSFDVRLSWKTPFDASGYLIEIIENVHFIQYRACREPEIIVQLSANGSFVWRVWSIFADGLCSMPSQKASFTRS